MGCDIHLHIEAKVDGNWEHYAQLEPPRNYPLFTKMAGVRNYDNEIEPIAAPRGLPNDVTTLTRVDAAKWAEDGHGWSWLSNDEIGQLADFFDGRRGDWPPLGRPRWFGFEEWVGAYLYGDPFTARETCPWIEDVRFVFWFDN